MIDLHNDPYKNKRFGSIIKWDIYMALTSMKEMLNKALVEGYAVGKRGTPSFNLVPLTCKIF